MTDGSSDDSLGLTWGAVWKVFVCWEKKTGVSIMQPWRESTTQIAGRYIMSLKIFKSSGYEVLNFKADRIMEVISTFKSETLGNLSSLGSAE